MFKFVSDIVNSKMGIFAWPPLPEIWGTRPLFLCGYDYAAGARNMFLFIYPG